VREGRTFSAGDQEIWEVSAAFGWINSSVVPIRGPFGYFACVGMDSPERNLDLSAETRSRLQMIALLAHERCFTLSGFAKLADPAEALTARERECLRWGAAGKTDWEIGVILGISAATALPSRSGARQARCENPSPSRLAARALRPPMSRRT
jgi:LuxR family quorum sensing-dependent transcriptional regulator